MKQQSTRQPVFLGFASQKGGVGKSTLAEVLASILYYEREPLSWSWTVTGHKSPFSSCGKENAV